eukprot:TRINITY_DN2124_c0_g1_i1.p1 TRINITY_DN2124_c0_g1~~TRINITY_DN2124_c0_g1_i1.p1  ORF type:complete len:381 (-),score=77.70 TRINITY_DN2124_c0_g1_i1:87-1229(-)
MKLVRRKKTAIFCTHTTTLHTFTRRSRGLDHFVILLLSSYKYKSGLCSVMGNSCAYGYEKHVDLGSKKSTVTFFDVPQTFPIGLSNFIRDWTMQHLHEDDKDISQEYFKRNKIIKAQLHTELDDQGDDIMRITSPKLENAFREVSSPIRKKEYIALFRVLEKARQLVTRRFILLKEDAIRSVPELRSYKTPAEVSEAAIEFVKLYLRDLYWNNGLSNCQLIFRTREIQEVLEEMLEQCLMNDNINLTPLLPAWFLKSCVSHAWVAFLWTTSHQITDQYLSSFDLADRREFLKIHEEERRYFMKHLGFLYSLPSKSKSGKMGELELVDEDEEAEQRLQGKNLDQSYLYDFATSYLPDVSKRQSSDQTPLSAAMGTAKSIVG